MIIKRPVLMRRPMLQSPHTMPSSALSLSPRPHFMERKKAVYKLPSSVYRMTPDKLSHTSGSHQISKLMKLDTKSRLKLEAKVSEAIPGDVPENLASFLKPARNTGFDPGSIVIEGGFKPIIKSIERSSDVAQKRVSHTVSQNEATVNNNSDYRPIDNFEPVFIPSPPVAAADAAKKLKKKTRNTKLRADEVDDMEMAADRLDAYYLPPASSTKLDDLPSSSPGVLITFDGKKLKDSSLARSISGIEEQSKSALSSDILSRTPQFGRFKGELPPPIPGEVRSDDTTEHEPRRTISTGLSVPEMHSKKNTKLTLVGRSKRSAHEGHAIESTHAHGNNANTNDNKLSGITALTNASHVILANFGYIVLTVILYYII